MKLLQVGKKPEIVSGVVGCIWSICQTLPDWSHALFFCSLLSVPERTREALDGYRLGSGPALTAEWLRGADPDVILFHNTADDEVPLELLPGGAVAIYYYHSSYTALGGFSGVMERCRRSLAVSEFLARSAGMPADSVLYQPVPAPPRGARENGGRPRPAGELVVGRLCNPREENWPESMLDFYRSLAARCPPRVRWEFVGCPPKMRPRLAEACGGAVFHETGLGARSLLWSWHAMLYDSGGVVHSYGRTLCEAQRAGCVPVVNRLGGFPEQIEEGRTGFLCQGPEEFARALERLDDPETWSALSREARAAGDRRGSLERWREGFLELCGVDC